MGINKHILFLLLIIIPTGRHLLAQPGSNELANKMEKKQHPINDSTLLPYRFWNPFHSDAVQVNKFFTKQILQSNRKLPMVLFLHGSGERGTDNEAQLIHGVRTFVNPGTQQQHPCFVVAPQCAKNHRWVEVDWKQQEHTLPQQISMYLQAVNNLVDSLIEIYPIDTTRLYITGLSMGGFGTWDYISRFPDKFAAAVPICGGADQNKAQTIKHLPIWNFHGATDKIVKVERSRKMIAALKAAGGSPRYTEYANIGHLVWDTAYAEPELIEWIFSQQKTK